MNDDPQSLDVVVSYLRQHPEASRRQVIKALGVPAKVVRRAEGRLDDLTYLHRRRRNRYLLLTAGVLTLAGASWGLYSVLQARHQAALRKAEARQAAVNRLQEQTVYTALDKHDAKRSKEFVAYLKSKDASLRLAALRYLSSLDSGAHLPEMVPLLQDPSSRVRLAAIQLLGERPEKPVEQALVEVVSSKDRPLNERTLGLQALGGRKTATPRALARELVPLLRDPQVTVRKEAEEALVRLTGLHVKKDLTDPQARFRAWADLLKEAS